MKLEVKVGLFVFIGLLSLFILSMQVNSFANYGKKGYKIYGYLNDASGLRKEAKVRMKGVSIGYVENKQLLRNKVRITLFISKGIEIPKDSIIALSQNSMLGEKYIKIIPSNSTIYLKPGEELTKYKQTASFNEAVDSINAAAQEFKTVVHKLNLVLDKNVTHNIKLTVKNIKDSSATLKQMLVENRVNLKDTIAGAKEAMVTINQKLPKIMAQIDGLTYEFNKTGAIVNNKLPKLMNKVDNLTDEFTKTGKHINKKLPILLTKFGNIEDNVTTILVENRKPLHDTIKSANGFFGGGENVFSKLDDYFTSLTRSELDVEIGSYYMNKDKYMQTRAELAYRPKPDKYYILGVTSTNDYTDSSKFNAKHEKTKTYITAELGKRYDNLLVRGGLIDSTGGIGLDYFMDDDNLRLRADIYDFNAVNDIRGNQAHARVEARYRVLKHINFYGGYDNFLNSKAANLYLGLGIGFEDDDLKTILGSSGALLK